MTKAYKPFKLLEAGEMFRDLDTGAVCMKITAINSEGDRLRVSAGHGLFQRHAVDAVALEPFKAHGRDYPRGAALAFDEKEAVELI
jgi:hypothetical protein